MPSYRIPSLDGLRAISIVFVILAHISHTHGFPFHAWFIGPFGDFGVRIFFVISGYLITLLLLKERHRNSKIDLPNFYARRTLRIFPLAYAFIALAVILHGKALSTVNILTALTYTQNFSSSPQWFLGHLWSLSVEEQFYLLWPLVLAVFYHWRREVLWTTICLIPLFNGFLIYRHSPLWGRSFFSVADALAVGCWLGIAKFDRLPVLDRIINVRWFWIIPLFALLSAPLVSLKFPPLASLLRTLLWRPLIHFAVAFSIERAVRQRYRILNWAPIVWLGMMSYSLYLCQQLFTDSDSVSRLSHFPWNALALLLTAVSLHFLVERPFLSLRNRRIGNGKQARKASDAQQLGASLELGTSSSPEPVRTFASPDYN